jgi:hypothetical protein
MTASRSFDAAAATTAIAVTVGVMLRAAPRMPFSNPIKTTSVAMSTTTMTQRMSIV